jgi:hypothetical protein
MELRLARLLAAVLALAALLGVAAWLPLAHSSGAFAPRRLAAPRAKRPAWPLWAHGQQLHATTPVDSTPPEGALSAPQRGERPAVDENATPGSATDGASRPALYEQPLWLGVARLIGITAAIPTPPPRPA